MQSQNVERTDSEDGSLAGQSVRVLVIDDDQAKRVALRAALSPLGLNILEADSGIAALRTLMDYQFAVILLDIFMPMMNGFETAALIRQRKQCEMTPIIFITASGSDEIADADRFAEGAVDFIFAPVDPAELRAKVTFFANVFLKAEQLATRSHELEISADHLRLLTDVAPIGIFQTDADNRYIYTNPRWTELTGISSETARGRRLDTVIATELRSGLMSQLSDPSLSRDEFSYRFEIPRPHSDPLIALMTAVPIPSGSGKVAGWIGTVADVTAETGAEAAMAEARDAATSASQLKSDFLANMSHEIRTPMNGVMGMADLLLATPLDTHQRDYAQTVRDSGEALLAIINDILDLSKVEAGMLTIEREPFDLRSLIHDVVDLLAGLAQQKGIDLVARVDRDVPDSVCSDAGRLRQVLLNLVGNAIKFTHTGDVVVEVHARSDDASIHVEVIDTGDGIPPEKIDTIFQPFVQVDASTSRRYGGSGLGLAISGQLIALMGGHYGVMSEPGSGSTFWFTVPADIHPDGIRAFGTANAWGEFDGFSALVVDGSEAQRSLLTDILTEWGMIVTAVGSGEEALSSLQAAADQGRPASLVLLDLAMPDVDGFGWKERIDGLHMTTPVILMVGIGKMQSTERAQTSGFRAVLSKPVHRMDLLTCIRIALDLVPADLSEPEMTLPPTKIPSSSGGRLLLVEDNMINQKVALAMLKDTGYSVDAVVDGTEAIEAFGLNRYDAILMDCQMPGMNGYQATSAIRSLEGSASHTPIIALTAGARTEDRQRCLSGGMDGYLVKPVNKDALLDLLATSIDDGRKWLAAAAESCADAVETGPATATEPLPEDASMGHTATTQEPALDAEAVRNLEQLTESGGVEFVNELLDLFVADANEQLEALRRGIAECDTESVMQSAHSLSGASANVGAATLAGLCSKLSRSPDIAELPSGLEPLVREVELEFERVQGEIHLRRSSDAVTSIPRS
jgi:PAS domain S-box-containing protein